ncbi:MAG: 30S ribosome-binding factor RbfA [Acholeplasmatales bacterium]|jgi:ribosome-binding factor A|nr:30S ribosome-binding factor RbfA [Acholeplasmatales bacterium]
MNYNNLRIASSIQRNLSIIVNRIVIDDIIGFISITEVKLTNNYSFATIYFSILKNDDETINYATKTLEEKKVPIRMELSKTICHIKTMPQLIFKFDKSMAYSQRIEEILKDIKDKESKN